MSHQQFTISYDDLPTFVRELLVLLQSLPQPTVLALQGDLGAGKTTLVQLLARELGVRESITSPTFMIMRRYATTDQTWSTLVHIDAYRIDDIMELAPLKFDELLEESGTLICIEWADQIADALHAEVCWLRIFNTTDEKKRTIQLELPSV